MEQFNVSAFLFVNQYAGKSKMLDSILITAVDMMPYLFVMVLLYLWFSSNIEKKQASLNAVMSVALGMLTSNVISMFYYNPRPFVENLGVQLIEHAPDSSFPSDHATFTFSVAITLLLNKETRVLGIVLFVLSLISSMSRVYGGIHYPLDILGAVFVALFASKFASTFVLKASKKRLLAMLSKKSA